MKTKTYLAKKIKRHLGQYKINKEADEADGVLRLSMDAKAKAKVGPLSRGGKSRQGESGLDVVMTSPSNTSRAFKETNRAIVPLQKRLQFLEPRKTFSFSSKTL